MIYGRKLSAGGNTVNLSVSVSVRLTRYDEDISILVSVVRPVSGRAVTDGEPWCLVTDQLKQTSQ